MKNNRNNKLIIYLIIIILIIYSFLGPKGELVENLDIPVGIGYDLEEISEKNVSYRIPIAIYLFEENDISSDILTGKGVSIGLTRENRQAKSNKSFLLGLERVLILSEKTATYGIRPILDILLNNPQINDRAPLVVYKGKAEDILNYKVKGYPNSAEYIEGLIRSAKQFNFFPDRQYSLMDAIVRVDAEGRNTLLPYIGIEEKDIKIEGLAIFKQDKMIAKTNIQEAKIINLLKENGVKGILTIQETSKEYIDFYAESKRKVECYKEGDKFKFIINLNLKGSINSNLLYKKLKKDPKVLKKFTSDLEESTKKMCEDFINKKIKNEYKTDVLDLGRVAAAKYGRGKGIDWNKVVNESTIEVNVKVKVDTEGRGDYQPNNVR